MDEDFIKPPQYTESTPLSQNSLIDTLKNRIERDLFQIYGVYDERINNLLAEKQLMHRKVEESYNKLLENLYNERTRDIDDYNKKTEINLCNILSQNDTISSIKVPYSIIFWTYVKSFFK